MRASMSRKNITIGVVALVILGLIGFGGYQIWMGQRLAESEELAQQDESRQASVIDLNSSSESSEEFDELSQVDDSDQEGDALNPQVETADDTSMPTPNMGQELNLPTVIGEGVFSGSGNYRTSGGVQVIDQGGDQIIIQLAPDFSFSGAPDPFLYLSSNEGNGIDNAVRLGKLQSDKGAQAYSVTRSEWEANNAKVVLWCQAFSVYMGGAVV
jgi:hypothetical protein